MDFDFLPEAKQKWIHSLIYLRIPKTASSSIISCLNDRNLVWKHRGLFAEKFQKLLIYKGVFDTTHASPSECYQILGKQVYDYFSFTCIRHPCDRILSSFFFGKKNNLAHLYSLDKDCSFEQYIDFLVEAKKQERKDVLILRSQTEYTHSNAFRPNHIIYFERLNEGWAEMLEEYKIEGLPKTLPHSNKTEHKDWREYFSADMRKKIVDLFPTEYDSFNYES